MTHHGLILFPLVGPGLNDPGYLTLDEALARGVVEITEMSWAGVVPAAKTIVIPVSCVEAGRWSFRSEKFAAAPSGRLRHFSIYDFLTLDAICRDLPLREAMRGRMTSLVEAGAIETQGRGRGVRHLLSRELYAAIGQKGVYTRRKDLDHETNKALLMQHLAGNPDVGAPLAALCQVLPAQSTSSVQRLLRELRAEGRVILRGSRRGARWYPAGVQGQDVGGI